jgi:hypothetical protein
MFTSCTIFATLSESWDGGNEFSRIEEFNDVFSSAAIISELAGS